MKMQQGKETDTFKEEGSLIIYVNEYETLLKKLKTAQYMVWKALQIVNPNQSNKKCMCAIPYIHITSKEISGWLRCHIRWAGLLPDGIFHRKKSI